MSLPTTIIEYAHRSGERSHNSIASFHELTEMPSMIKSASKDDSGVVTTEVQSDALSTVHLQQSREPNPEFRLPGLRSLIVIIGGNVLYQISFFIIVSSASVYAELLGGTQVFSGLTIGIPTVFSGLSLLLTTRIDGGVYKLPMHIALCASVLGNMLYALAYRAQFLYLILIGRMVTGVGFISFMYSKRYCSDPRIVGIRRRTTLASWLVVGQGVGFTAGPFLGGALFKMGFGNRIFNGLTSPGWIMALIFIMAWVASAVMFEDVTHRVPAAQDQAVELSPTSSSHLDVAPTPTLRSLGWQQWGVIACMCWYAMTCFLILGAWEANLPIFTATTVAEGGSGMGYSPYNAGNFLALGGLVTLPFLLLNVRFARRFQDRTILAFGSSLGTVGLLLTLILIKTHHVTFGSLIVCWVLIALGFNLASTCTLSLLSKQLPDAWNGRVSIAIQYSNYTGRVTGAVLGGAGVKIGMARYIGVQLGVVGVGLVMYLTLWKSLKAKTG